MHMNRMYISSTVLALAVHTACAVEVAPASGVPSPNGHDQVAEVLRAIKWGAYGEAHYSNFQGNGKDDQLDLHRLVLLAEARITDHWRFVTEIEIEHAFVRGGTKGGTDSTANGYVAVEQGYLGYRFAEAQEAKVGVMLVPISIMNLYHEPTIFHGVERPLIDNRIIPSTWYEVGAGVEGRVVEGLTYAVAVQGGLNGTLMKPGNGFREGRQKAAESSAEDLMATARLDWKPGHGLWLAVSANGGGIDQRNESESGDDGVYGTLLVGEVRWAHAGFEAGATAAEGRLSDSQELPTAALPKVFRGLSTFLAYDLLRPLGLDRMDQLFLFGRYEAIDNNAAMPDGVARNESLNTDVVQFGLTWRPNTWVVLKTDYQRIENHDGSRADIWNLGAGFAF